MPISVQPDPVEFDITDYFSKFGFGDGDDSILQELALSNRERVIQFFNEEFKAASLPLKAEEYDGGSIHNNCRIVIKHTGTDDELDWDYGNKNLGDLRKPFDLTLSIVEKRLTMKFKSQENKGAYKPGTTR